jgi:hypothetical protein
MRGNSSITTGWSLESRMLGNRARPVRAGGRWKRTCEGRHLANGLPVLRHARVSPGREIETAFEITQEKLRVEVSDASHEIPALRHPSASDEEGRGLALVAMVATRWGTAARKVNGEYAVGKTVWFEIDREEG